MNIPNTQRKKSNGLLRTDQIEIYNKESAEKQFEDKSIPQKKVDLTELEERIDEIEKQPIEITKDSDIAYDRDGNIIIKPNTIAISDIRKLSTVLSQIEERFEQQRVEFDETMNYMEIKYSNQRPAIQVYVYDNNSTEAIRSECSIHDKNNDTLIIAWERGYRGYILVNKFE